MRLAIVFHGIIGGTAGRNGLGDPVDIETCAKTIKHNVISRYDTDVFLHSWSIEHEQAIKDLYNPISALFEPQEYFGYNFSDDTIKDENKTHAFRTVSRYNSLYRAIQLKKEHEKLNNFKYDWVLVLRYDLVMFTPLELEKLDRSGFYICREPYWPNIHSLQMLHDIVFLSNSELIDTYCDVTTGLNMAPYSSRLHEAHRIAYLKLHDMFKGNMNRIGYAFDRYKDMEIYRMIIDPSQSPTGHMYGGNETKTRLEKLLEEINGT